MYDIMLYLVVILCNSFSTFNIMYINVVCTYSSDEEFTALCGNELLLLESCLRVNPKSYGVWLHRQWVMTTSPQPDWKNEKKLCDLFLNYDERNCKYHVRSSFHINVHCIVLVLAEIASYGVSLSGHYSDSTVSIALAAPIEQKLLRLW